MRLFNRATLRDFWRRHPDAQHPLRAWLAEVEKGSWTGPAEVRARYRTADFIEGDRIIFNVGGNKYRLVVHVAYEYRRVLIKFVGTHREYDRIDAETIR